jgi:hypothetical protein
MTISEAQADLRRAYVDGGPGTMISGSVWIAAAVAQARGGVEVGFAVLFFGGMLIFPVTFVVRVLLRREKVLAGNTSGRLVLESTVAMIAGLFAAWLFLPHAPDLVMPLAALAVGAHYFVFRTAYGLAAFWVLGAGIVGLSVGAILGVLAFAGSFVLVIGAVEVLAGAALTIRTLRAEPLGRSARPDSSASSRWR